MQKLAFGGGKPAKFLGPRSRVDNLEMPRPAPVQRDTDSNPLLPDELAMVRMVAQGVPEMAMARRLGINETQVRDRLLVIFRKLAVAGLLDQLVYAGEKIWKPR